MLQLRKDTYFTAARSSSLDPTWRDVDARDDGVMYSDVPVTRFDKCPGTD